MSRVCSVSSKRAGMGTPGTRAARDASVPQSQVEQDWLTSAQSNLNRRIERRPLSEVPWPQPLCSYDRRAWVLRWRLPRAQFGSSVGGAPTDLPPTASSSRSSGLAGASREEPRTWGAVHGAGVSWGSGASGLRREVVHSHTISVGVGERGVIVPGHCWLVDWWGMRRSGSGTVMVGDI